MVNDYMEYITRNVGHPLYVLLGILKWISCILKDRNRINSYVSSESSLTIGGKQFVTNFNQVQNIFEECNKNVISRKMYPDD